MKAARWAAVAAMLTGCGGLGSIPDDGRCRDTTIDMRGSGQATCPHPHQRAKVAERAGGLLVICQCPADPGVESIRVIK